MRHLRCAETAKLVRKALKAAFPGIKFSVRSKTYAGGASIDIRWTDGPTTKEVDKVAGIFAGAEFDGMVDCKYYSDHWLMPDGTVTIAKKAGDHGFEPVQHEAPGPGAERVSMGADFIFTDRANTPEFTERVGRAFAAKMGWEMPNVYDSGGFEADFTKCAPGDHRPVADRFNRKLWATSEADLGREEEQPVQVAPEAKPAPRPAPRPAPKPEPTVAPAEDDSPYYMTASWGDCQVEYVYN